MSTIRIHELEGYRLRIRQAPVRREWMEGTRERFAYHCLPLNIANAHGWQILCPARFRARWHGGEDKQTLEIEAGDVRPKPAMSHFGHGILTFHVPAVITTPPGVSILATGPFNAAKAGISPLTGIIETDWLPFPFTMNWQMEPTGEWVTFEEDEPFCMFFPLRLTEVEGYDLELVDIATNPPLERDMKAYRKSRSQFLKDLNDPESEAVRQRWQKDYFRGPGGGQQEIRHRTSLKLAKPVRK